MDDANIAKCVGFESLRDPESMVAAYQDEALNIELGVIGGKLLAYFENLSADEDLDEGFDLSPQGTAGTPSTSLPTTISSSSKASVSRAILWLVGGLFIVAL